MNIKSLVYQLIGYAQFQFVTKNKIEATITRKKLTRLRFKGHTMLALAFSMRFLLAFIIRSFLSIFIID